MTKHLLEQTTTDDVSNKTQRSIEFEYTGSCQIVPKDVVNVRFHSSIIKVDDNAFRGCNSLIEVVLNEGLVEIGESAFADCKALESITLPSTVTTA